MPPVPVDTSSRSTLMPAVFWPHTDVPVSAVLLRIAGNCCLPSFGGGRGHAPGTPDTLDGPSTSRFPLAPDHVPDLAASATQPMETAPNAGMRTYVHDLPFANLDQRRSAWAGSRKPSERQADHLESDHRSSADVMQYSAKAEVARNDCVPQPHGIRDSPVESDSAASQCHALSAVDFPRSIGTRRLVPTGFC